MIIKFKNAQQAERSAERAQKSGHQVAVNKEIVAFMDFSSPSDLAKLNHDDFDQVWQQHPSYIKSSRIFHPDDTIIRTKHSVIGGNHFTLIAGPDSIESEEHILKMGQAVKEAGATILRGGSFKPRTSPYTFQGLGEKGLKYHRAAADKLNMDMVTEIMDTRDLELVDRYTDIFQVGARNMQNFSLLKALGEKRKPVLLKRGMSATIDDLLNAAEYIAAGGNDKIVLVERGIRTFDNKYTRNTFDVGAIPVLKDLTHYPIIGDPSHAAGFSEYVTPIGLAAVAAGAQGLIVEIHDQPDKAFVDGRQALTPTQYKKLAEQSIKIFEL
ncbi:3-deoxy-7-phosphoheptulonate synthase [Xylocopilactobacillus apis]|uniref:3-deoxy-7-phosphoheptulonate synthase n=1 Tax=Xylocopilactobacillus apis TaxID=2932183 RepID=A0AAU9D4R2_9LACO|nr:3-deoxy-7-phosphoheptulonate synthase [Xylocopilactobacillus apis]BDR57275.1 3-deoxy-7-phosphoheptulonate synthase [Xylocopilactobacillus apis]